MRTITHFIDGAAVSEVGRVQDVFNPSLGAPQAQVQLGDAAHAAGRAALAVHALTSDPSVLLAATEDRLHQNYREPAWPDTVRVINDLRKLGVPACVSGAGPTVIAFGELPAEVDLHGFDVRNLDVDRSGVRVRGPASSRSWGSP